MTRALSALLDGRFVSIRFAMMIRRLGFGPEGLLTAHLATQAGAPIDPELATYLPNVELGSWALGPRSLNYLMATVKRKHPRLIIEFGSGVSTLALALQARRAGTSAVPRVVSFEQDDTYAAATRALLVAAGLADDAIIVVRPVIRQIIDGVDTECYSLSEEDLAGYLAGRKADLVVVDGPAGGETCRYGTLHLIAGHVNPGAAFVLDDALRDGELKVARLWRRAPSIHIRGIQMIEKGLLVGTIEAPGGT